MTETFGMKALFNFFTFCVGGIMAYLGINGEAYFLLAVLLFIDYITGIMKAKSLGHCITSNKMKYGVISKFSLLFIPVILAIGAKAVGADFKTILTVGINILVLSEVYSVIGNVYSIRTKQELPEYDAVAMIGHKIRSALVRISDENDIK